MDGQPTSPLNAYKKATMSRPPLVTVIVSVFNGAPYLAQTLDSILAQSFSHFTLLLVDDASTDSTPAIIADYAGRDSRIRAMCNPHNKGIAASHNIAMEASNTPYISPMGADDLVTPDWLEKKCPIMEAQPHLAALGNALQNITEDGVPQGTAWTPVATPHALRSALFTSGTGMPHGSSLLRTEVLKRLGGYRENFAAALDVDLWLRMVEHYDIACLPDILLLYRQHSTSVTHTKAATQAYNHILALIASEQRRMGKPDPIEGKELTGELMESLLQSGTQSALTWFCLLSHRLVPHKEKYLYKACVMAYDRPCTTGFLRQQLPIWRYFTQHYPQCIEEIVAAAQSAPSSPWKNNVLRVHTGATMLMDYARTLDATTNTSDIATQLAAYAQTIVRRLRTESMVK